MSDHENYNVPLEKQEDIRKLVYDLYAARGYAPPSEEDIIRVCASWVHGAKLDNVSILEFAKGEIADFELEKKIDAESTTCEERRQRIERELGITAEDQGTLDIAMDDLEWLEVRTGRKNEEIHRLSDETLLLLGQHHSDPEDENARNAYEHSAEKLESEVSKAKKRLQLVLRRQQKQNIKSSVNVSVKHIQPCARTASRAHNSAPRPTFTGSGGGGSVNDDDDGDTDCSDPPLVPYPICPKQLNSTLHPWLVPGSWLITEGRRAA
ncbi:MAG: hypothetical protein LBS45_06640 [Synergistaceae bacterium]|jgi:hypothetical protein|nr:hypothetical protein [Synergistaceae bacterium]